MAAQADHADQREKAQHDEPEHRKLLEQEMVQFLFEGKDVHIEGYTPPENSKGPAAFKKQTQHARPE